MKLVHDDKFSFCKCIVHVYTECDVINGFWREQGQQFNQYLQGMFHVTASSILFGYQEKCEITPAHTTVSNKNILIYQV